MSYAVAKNTLMLGVCGKLGTWISSSIDDRDSFTESLIHGGSTAQNAPSISCFFTIGTFLSLYHRVPSDVI